MDRSIAKARVIRAWTASYDPALSVRAGDIVEIGAEDETWPGFFWCTNKGGLSGWLPGHVLDGSRVLADFDTRELSVAVGALVETLETCLGWSRVRGSDGREGWVPSDHLAL
ncbi:MAG: SH3 domain-containing protein [Pseudomonadota bacterium]